MPTLGGQSHHLPEPEEGADEPELESGFGALREKLDRCPQIVDLGEQARSPALVHAPERRWLELLGQREEELGVPLRYILRLARTCEALGRELPDRLEHPVPRAEVCVATAEQALVEERLQSVRIGATDLLGRRIGATAGEDGQRAKEALLLLVEQIV